MTDSDRAAVVPAVGTPGSLSTIRSLGRAGVYTISVSEMSRPPSFSSRYCDATRAVPDPTADLAGYRDALLALAARGDVETIVPVREADVHVLASHREQFGAHIEPLWPDRETLDSVHDRLALTAAAERAGVATPETVPLDAIDDWDRERIVKARYALLTDRMGDVAPNTCRQPPTTQFLAPGETPDIEARVEQMGHVPVAQTYLDGPEFCLRALCVDGEAIVTSQKRLHRGYKYARGPSVYHEAVDDRALTAAGEALLAELDYTGLASVGFIRDEGRYRLLEINPRVPASIPVDIHAGVDYPRACWRLATGRAVDPAEYRPGTHSHLLRGELVHLHSVIREEYPLAKRPGIGATVGAIARSVLEHPNFDTLSRDDPRPFVRDALNVSRSMVPISR
ncbi:carboxylate--amine ligase [Halococcoides cellulosivorans]|uniref:Carboxylate--amine ligase n=1 Tax=Halococcoides cellulosivorans TaxID=1679096 RepID=A0A2R4X3E3_9EURY|nr:ATP-grasp domain-containing protein [Halococcoides cellulosivorans]AWB28315.1 carboxylate--amine ligase [Halococcoides cellulosivorans]